MVRGSMSITSLNPGFIGTTLGHPQAGEGGSQAEAFALHRAMLDTIMNGEGVERIAQLASQRVGVPVVIEAPLFASDADTEPGLLARYVAEKLAGRAPDRPRLIAAEVPIESGSECYGWVLMLGEAPATATEYLQAAAAATLTAILVQRTQVETERRLRGSFLEELLADKDFESGEIRRRAQRLGCDLSDGVTAFCVEVGDKPRSSIMATIAVEAPNALFEEIGGRIYGLLPGGPDTGPRLSERLSRFALTGVSTHHHGAGEARLGLEEAELVLDVCVASGESMGDALGTVTYRLLLRMVSTHPDEMKVFVEGTVAPLLRYDDQYDTDLVGTLSAYLHEHNCNMSATAQAIFTHRHTVGYRLDRVRELTGLDPMNSEHRERLGLGLKALRIIDPKEIGVPR
jgi:hypothetical protein